MEICSQRELPLSYSVAMEEAETPANQERVVGSPSPSDENAEAGGRSKWFLYTCYFCGAGNYVDPANAALYSCWRCGSHSEHSDP
jgi:hypothetical protein